MLEVEVENFQSIDKASVRIEGFTALVGRSNLGKSAVVRAIKYALTGALGSDFVRHGASCARIHRKAKSCDCFTKVTISGDGMAIVWEKGDSVNQYTITRGDVTHKYSALDRGEPEFLKPEFQQIEVGDDRLLLQVADQFKPIFLLNKSGGVVADVLSDVANLDDTNEAIRLVNRDRKEASSTRTVREKDRVSLQASLSAFDGVDDLADRSTALDKLVGSAKTLSHAVEELRFFDEGWEHLESQCVSLQTALLPHVQEWGPLSETSQNCFSLDRFLTESASLTQQRAALEAAVLPELSSWDVVAGKARLHSDLSRLCAEAMEKGPAVKRLAGVGKIQLPRLDGVSAPLDKITLLEGWVRQLRAIKDTHTRLQNLGDLKEVTLPSFGDQVLSLTQAQRLEKAFGEAEREATVLTEELEKAQVEEQSLLEEFSALGVCPTCEQELGQDHRHQGRA